MANGNLFGQILGQMVDNEQSSMGLNASVLDMLSQRNEPTLSDVSESIVRSAVNPAFPQYQPRTPQELAAERFNREMAPYTALANIQAKRRAAAQNLGGATGELIDRYMQDNPGTSYSQALYAVQGGGLKKGFSMTPEGRIMAMAGAPESAGEMKYGETFGRERAEIQTAAEKERQKVIGKGELTELEKRGIGQTGLSATTTELSSLYDELEKSKAAVSTAQTPMENISARVRSTALGQAIGRALGTKEQSIRNKINMQIPNLINDIRQATGMSAKAMDSNAELQFYLKMATDPNVDVQANRSALETIEKKYLSRPQAAQENVNIKGQKPTIDESLIPELEEADLSQKTKRQKWQPPASAFDIDKFLKQKGF